MRRRAVGRREGGEAAERNRIWGPVSTLAACAILLASDVAVEADDMVWFPRAETVVRPRSPLMSFGAFTM